MAHVTYKIRPHDGGWAYTADGVFSEPYPTHDAAKAAAQAAAREQTVPGDSAEIEYQDADGNWHVEAASGHDRPEADVR